MEPVVLHSASPFITNQPKSRYSFYHPMDVEGGVNVAAGCVQRRLTWLLTVTNQLMGQWLTKPTD